MSAWLFQYQRRSPALFVTEYPSREAAFAARMAAERTNRDPDLEIVAFTADSLEEIGRTHGRYFSGAVHFLSPEEQAEAQAAEEALIALEEGRGVEATCVRVGDWWAITVPGVEGGYTQARSLDEALAMVADLRRMAG